jgi:hypothetical protein
MAHRIPGSADDSQDPLNRMRVFQLAGELIPDLRGGLLHRSEHFRSLLPELRERSSDAI